MSNKIICTNCEDFREFKVHTKKSSLKLRGEVIEYEDHLATCNVCGTDLDLEDGSDVLRDVVYPIYRAKHKFVTPEKMIEFRKARGLTQKEMSILLGWGHVTLTRYENGALQDDAHDSAFQMAMNQHGFRVLLVKHGHEIPEEKRKKLLVWATGDIVEAVKNAIASLKDEILPEIRKNLEAHIYQLYIYKMTQKSGLEEVFVKKSSTIKVEKSMYASFNMHKIPVLQRH